MIDFKNAQPVQPSAPGANPALDDPTERSYRLKCYVFCKRVTFLDEQSQGTFNNETVNVYLIPDQSTQMQLFYGAWLPEKRDEHHELAVLLGNPGNIPARCSIHRWTKHMQKPHLMVMSQEAENSLIKFFNANLAAARTDPYRLRIDVTTLPASQETILG